MVSFGFKKLPSDKILKQWKSRSFDNIHSYIGSPAKNKARISILKELEEPSSAKRLTVIPKSQIDSVGRPERKAVGVADIQVSKARKQINVKYLAGNPLSDVDDDFSGAVKGLASHLVANYPADHTVVINTHYPEVSTHYQKVLGTKPQRMHYPGVENKIYSHITNIQNIADKLGNIT